VKFKRQLSDMARDIEKRFTAQGFPLDRPDIDITEVDDKKIVIH
jgi:hypothetical protein